MDFSKSIIFWSNYRNLCAHEDIVYEHKTQTFISDTIYHEKLNISKNELGEYKQGKNDLFALIIILKQVLQADRFKEMMAEINRCFDIFDLNVNTIDVSKLLHRMGFPDNYMDIIDIKGGLNE
jgi:abortive infection bacteriophage resistance protein